ILVGGDLVPDADVAVDRPRLLLPGLVAGLAGTRNGVEGPQLPAGADVEAADQPLGVVVRLRRAAFEHRRADHHHAVLGDRRRRVQPDLAGLAIDLLLLPDHHLVFQIDDAVAAERRDAYAGSRVEGDEAVAGGDVENPFVAAVGPVGDAATGELSRRRGR